MLEILPLAALRDNYIWVLRDSGSNRVAIVDPGEAKPVLEYLQAKQLELSCILVTHHHWDHTDGIPEILKQSNVPVYGPGPNGQQLRDKQQITLPDQKVNLKVMHIPGHTLDHVAFYNDEVLFSGDTLFAAGCGRVFEGTHAQMYNSLKKLKALPKNTKVYCGHEYTVNNLKFVHRVAPDNQAILDRLEHTEILIKKKQPTLPSTLQAEMATNLFLMASTLEEFSNLRDAKDRF